MAALTLAMVPLSVARFFAFPDWHSRFFVVPLGLFFGRLGCWFGGCCFGLVSDHPLAVSFQVQDRGCLILSASYNRYQSELSAGVDAKQQKAGQRLSDAIK